MTPNGLDAILIHLDSLYRIAFCMLNEGAAAEACVQQACTAMHMRLNGLQAGSDIRFETFGLLFDEIRRRDRKWSLLKGRARPAGGGPLGAMRNLPSDQLAAVLLCDVEDFPEARVRDILKLDAASLAIALSDGRRYLHHAFSIDASLPGAAESAVV